MPRGDQGRRHQSSTALTTEPRPRSVPRGMDRAVVAVNSHACGPLEPLNCWR